VFAVEPSLYDWTSNGLASGNNVLEATLHALFELAERHVMSLLVEDGSVDFSACTAIDVAQSGDPVVRGVVERMAHRVGVRLLRVDVDWPIHTMAAVLLDARPFAHCSEVTFGYGAHLSPSVAATRALTEAAQARLALIHGAREDLQPTAYQREHGRVYRLFEGIAPERAWSTLTGHAGDSLDEDYRTLLGCFADAGFPTLYRVVLTPPDAAIAVVRVLMPGALNQFPR